MQKSGPGDKMQKAKLAGEVKFRHSRYQTGRKTSSAWNALLQLLRVIKEIARIAL